MFRVGGGDGLGHFMAAHHPLHSHSLDAGLAVKVVADHAHEASAAVAVALMDIGQVALGVLLVGRGYQWGIGFKVAVPEHAQAKHRPAEHNRPLQRGAGHVLDDVGLAK